MRVIWLSVGLLATFIVVLIALDEPEPDQTLVSPVAAVPDNPFVEEESPAQSSPVNIDLAVLPAAVDKIPQTASEGVASQSNISSAQMEESGILSDQPSAVITKTVSETSSLPAGSAKVATQSLSQSSTPPIVKEVASGDSPLNEVAVEKEAESDASDHKKLGLAMMVLEKENKKNKVAVIVHESNSQTLTEKEIKALYLDRMTRWQDGTRVMLYNLPLGDKIRDKFSTSVLKMSALEADSQETKRRELHINANQVEVKSKNVVVSYVEQHPNAVAYVPLSLVRDKSNVKVILTIP